MRPSEKFVSPLSDYYVHTPGRQAEGTLLCPLQTGRFVYEPGSPVESVTAYIAEHFAESLTVEDMAAKTGMTPFYFIRTFRREASFAEKGPVIC